VGVVGQDANRVVSEFQRVRSGEQEKQRWLLGGAAEAAGLVDEVITVFLKHLAGWTADGDAEEGEAPSVARMLGSVPNFSGPMPGSWMQKCDTSGGFTRQKVTLISWPSSLVRHSTVVAFPWSEK